MSYSYIINKIKKFAKNEYNTININSKENKLPKHCYVTFVNKYGCCSFMIEHKVLNDCSENKSKLIMLQVFA